MKIAVIDVNDTWYNETDVTYSAYSRDKMDDLMDDYVIFCDVPNNDGLMDEIISRILNDKNDFALHTAVVKNEYNNLYLMCHIAPSESTYVELKKRSIKYNGIASYLSDTGLRIYGRAVLFKMDTTCGANVLTSITMNEIVQLFTGKFVHKGVVINENGLVDEIKYIQNPVDWITPNEIHKYKFHETEILGRVLMFFFDTTLSSERTNKIATQICGKPLFGRVIIGMRSQYSDMNDTTNKYEDLDVSVIGQITKICQNPAINTKLAGNEIICDQLNTETHVYNNFHKILAQRTNIVQN